MGENTTPPAECLRLAAEALETAALHQEEGEIEKRDSNLNTAMAWLREADFEDEVDPLLGQGDLVKQIVDLTPDEVDRIRELWGQGTYSINDLSTHFRCSDTAVRVVVEYSPDVNV